MNKHNSASIGLVDPIGKNVTLDSARGVEKTKLWTVIALITGYVSGSHRHQSVKSYIPRNSGADESRLEFQRFLSW
jgi:hypothetical protein